MNDIKHKLIEQIKNGQVAMRPRWHFVLRAALMIVGTVLTVLVAIYLLSLVLYVLVQSGLVYAPEFGGRGLGIFLGSFPWLVVFCLLAFLGLLFMLVRQYAFSYHRPLIYSMVGVAVLVLAASFVIHQTTMHERLQPFMERHPVPGLGGVYQAARYGEVGGVVAGEVLRSTETGFYIKTARAEELEVIVTSDTRYREGSVWQVGDQVLVVGERTEGSDTIAAFGIRPDDGRRPGQGMQGERQGGQVFKAFPLPPPEMNPIE